MKFLVLIVAACTFAGIRGQNASTEVSAVAFQTLKEKANELFNEFTSKQSEIQTEIVYDYVYTKYETLNEKLQHFACIWKGNLIEAKADALNELQKSKEHFHQTTSSILKLCSITTTIDIDLHINPAIHANIQYDLTRHQDTLGFFRSNSYNIFDYTNVYLQFGDEVHGENVTVDSLQNYIYLLQSLLSNLRFDAKYKAQQYLNKMVNIIYYFDKRGEWKSRNYLNYLSNVNANFQHCVSQYGS